MQCNHEAVGQAVSQRCIVLSLVMQFQYSRLLPFHGRISKAYNTQIVKGALHPLRSRRPGASGGQDCERRPWPTDANNNCHCASPIMPGERTRPRRQYTPSYRESLLTRFLRSEPVKRYRPTRLFSSVLAFTEVPYERHPKTKEQSDHYLTLTTLAFLITCAHSKIP